VIRVETIFDRGSLPVLEAMVHFTGARHKAIANNIANAETPGYRAIDLPVAGFKRALARAIREQRDSRIGVFDRKVLDAAPLRYVATRETGALKENGNNVDLEIEMGRMARNGMLHNLSAALLAHQFGQLREAIGERVLS
jgi:flagellar basal-body rod protein FlgB